LADRSAEVRHTRFGAKTRRDHGRSTGFDWG
jgi:hypothetical protein